MDLSYLGVAMPDGTALIKPSRSVLEQLKALQQIQLAIAGSLRHSYPSVFVKQKLVVTCRNSTEGRDET